MKNNQHKVKKYVLLIIFTLIYNLANSFSLYNEIKMVVELPQPSLFYLKEKSKSTFTADYYDIYHYNEKKSKITIENSYINFQQTWTIPKLATNLSLYKRNGYYYVNDIDDSEDKLYINQKDNFVSIDFVYSLSPKTKLKFYLEKTNKIGALVGLNKKFGNHQFLLFSGIRFNRYELEYDIHDLDSYFPFGYALIDTKLGYENHYITSILTHQQIVPDKDDNDNYPSDIFGQNITLINKWKYKNYIFDFFISQLNISGKFEYNDKEFWKLDKLSLFFVRLNAKKLSKKININLGAEYYKFNVGEDSYFDVWPFSVWLAIYDFDKIRLKEFNVKLFQPFIKAEKEFFYKKSKHKLTLDYSHLFFDNDYFYKKRKIIFVYPQYVPYKGTLDLDIDAIIELKYDLQLLITNKCNIKFMLSQKIPIEYKRFHQTSEEGVSSNKKIHGGTKISLNLSYFF